MRKNRSIAGFGDVASESVNNNVNENDNDNNNNSENVIGAILTGDKRRTKVVGIHMDEDLNNTLDRLTSAAPRGAKSKLVNEAIRRFLEEQAIDIF